MLNDIISIDTTNIYFSSQQVLSGNELNLQLKLCKSSINLINDKNNPIFNGL
jgi:hypothetical protein